MSNKLKQLSTFEIQLTRLQELQKNCIHKYIAYPAGADYELDECYEVLQCSRCGHIRY